MKPVCTIGSIQGLKPGWWLQTHAYQISFPRSEDGQCDKTFLSGNVEKQPVVLGK